jgi:hypothetical protein
MSIKTVNAVGHYTIRTFTGTEDQYNVWSNDGNAIDDNTGTYAYIGAANFEKHLNFTAPDTTTPIYGIQIYCVNTDGITQVDADIWLDILIDGDEWLDVYNGTVTKNTWVTIDFDIEKEKQCDFTKARVTHEAKFGRWEFRVNEIKWLEWIDAIPAIFGAYSDYPSGTDCYGIYPYANFTIKDGNEEDSLTGEFWLKGVINGTWWKVADSSESNPISSIMYLNYSGDYWCRYGVKYYYRINFTDNYEDCHSLWESNTFSFTITPKPLDECTDSNSLPEVDGLTKADCWEMHGLNYSKNISKYNDSAFYFYNASNPTSKLDWNQSTPDTIYNGLFWWNSTSQSYDNVTWFEPLKGYWIYFYDKNWTIGSNYSCIDIDIDESMNTNSWKNFSLNNESWANFSIYLWFNDTNPDTLEFTINLLGQYINNSVAAGGCTGIVWVNYSDDNLTFNVSINKTTDANTSSYKIDEGNWLYMAGFSIDDSSFLFFLWAFVVYMMYKTNRNYIVIPLLLGLVQIGIIGMAYSQGFYSGMMEYWLVVGVAFLMLGFYKTYKGLKME